MKALHPDVERVLIDEDQLRERIAQMGADITRDYADVPGGLVVVSVLTSAAVFMADLVRAIDLPLEMDLVTVSSYGDKTESSGEVRLLKDLESNIEGRHVLIAEDLIDTGLTMSYLVELLQQRKPASLEIAALLHKHKESGDRIAPRYLGFDVPDEFVVGYGMDYAGFYRNLPYVGALKRSVYEADAQGLPAVE